MKKPLPITAAALIVLFILIRVLSGYFHSSTGRMIDRTRFLMGTTVRIKVPLVSREDEVMVKKAVDMAFEEIERIEGVFSVYKEDSEISRINRMGHSGKLKLSPEAYKLIEDSIRYSEATDGAFDITVKPLVDLWRKCGSEKKLPSEENLRTARYRVGYRYIVLDKLTGTISFAKDGMAIDLGGVAKGYATDMAIQVLKDRGIQNAIVNSGGDMYCLGVRSSGTPWSVGVRHPRNKNGLILELSLKDKAVDTSGDYEKFFVINGNRYSHIIDPRTGYPTGDDVVSSTVIAVDSKTADILATTLSVLGKKGLDSISNRDKSDAVIFIREADALKRYETPGFKERYEKK